METALLYIFHHLHRQEATNNNKEVHGTMLHAVLTANNVRGFINSATRPQFMFLNTAVTNIKPPYFLP
jgi:hypothetical protein